MNRSPLAVLIITALAGCANLSTQPPGTPTPAQIGVFGTAVAATNLSPADYLNYGLTSVEQNCATWFGDQVSGARATSTGQQLLSLFGTAAGATGTPVGAGVAAATSLGSAAIGAAQSNAPGGAMPAAIYTLVRKQLQAYVAAMPKPRTVADAAALIQAAAEYCQGPAIAGAVMTALVSSVASVWGPANFSAVEPAHRSGRVLPPVVTVGPPGIPPYAPPPFPPPPYIRPYPQAPLAPERTTRSRTPARPRAQPSASHADPAPPPRAGIRLIEERHPIDPEIQRRADKEWRDSMAAVIARLREPAVTPAPAPTPSEEIAVPTHPQVPTTAHAQRRWKF